MFATGYFPSAPSGSGVDEEVLAQMQADIDTQQALWDMVPEKYKELGQGQTAWGALVDIPTLNNAISIAEDGWAENLANTHTRLTTLQSLVENVHATQLTDLYTRTSNNTTSLTSLQNNVAFPKLLHYASDTLTVGRVILPRTLPPLIKQPLCEWIARPFWLDITDTNVTVWRAVSYDANNTYQINIGNTAPVPYVDASAASPAYVDKPGGVTFTLKKNTSGDFYWPRTGAWIFVHSFHVDYALPLLYACSRDYNSPTHPNFIYTREALTVYPSSGQSTVFTIPGSPATLTAGRIYIEGISWDFTSNPPRLTTMSPTEINVKTSQTPLATSHRTYRYTQPEVVGGLLPRHVDEVLGSNYQAFTYTGAASTHPLSAMTLYGRRSSTAVSNTAARIHWVGHWNQYLDRDDMLMMRERLRDRYQNSWVWQIGSVGIGESVPETLSSMVTLPAEDEDINTPPPPPIEEVTPVVGS